jgi:cobalt-zinc-cadmium efflux system protein
MHGHHDHQSVKSAKLIRYGIFLTMVIFLIKIIGGMWTGSLALLSDGWHLGGDLVTLLLSWWGVKQATRPVTKKQSFGMYRAEIVTAFMANLILIGVGGYIIVEAVHAFQNPMPVASGWVFGLTFVGLIVYTALAYLLGQEKQNMNAKSAWLHFVGDALSSVAILIGAAVIAYTGWYWLDAVLGGLVGLVIAIGAAKMAWEGAHILLEFAPEHVEPDDVEEALLQMEEVTAVTDLHLWSLTPTQHFMSVHLAVTVETIAEGELVIKLAQALMLEKFGIHHVTIQLETASCATCFHEVVEMKHCGSCSFVDGCSNGSGLIHF